ncbi:MAG: tetratricopeptide repeat protein [Acidobacteriota bacterium]
MERRASQESPVDLIDSGQFLVAEEIFSERRTNDPMEMVVRAEVAMYFDRAEDAASLLEEVAPRALDIGVAARFSLVRGRLALRQGDDQQAETNLQTALHIYRYLNDPFGLARSLLYLARLSRRHGNSDEAASRLSAAQEDVTGRVSKKIEFLRGLITTEMAAVALDRGEVDQATELYLEAGRQLKNAERGRYYGQSLVGLADLKCSLGEYQESLEIYKEANTVFERYLIPRELSEGYLKMAEALVRLKKIERAEKLAEDSRNVYRDNPAGQSPALAFMAKLALLKEQNEEAARLAASAVELADRSFSIEDRARARTARGQVELALHEFKQAVVTFTEAVQLASAAAGSSNSRRLELEATIYLAEAYHGVDTRAGRNELAKASQMLNATEDAWLGEEYDRVSTKYEEQIMLTDDNRLVFDGNQLPRWQEAKRTLEGFLLRNALRQTNNSLTRAARKLGVSKVHVHNLKKKHGL